MKNLRTRIILCLSVLLLAVFSGCSKDDDIAIKVIPLENVTNQDLEGYLLENFDTNKDGAISVPEAEAVTEIVCTGFPGLYSLDGIEYFTNLKILEISGLSDLTSLDLSKNTKLEVLNCRNSKITSLDLSNNTSLETLDCSSNAGITSLDLSKCTALKRLSCIGCNITELDVSYCTALKMLHCNGGEKISWSNEIRLDVLSLSGSDRTNSVDISNVHVAKFDCTDSRVVSVNASDNLSLKELVADRSSLVSLMAEGSGLVSASLEQCEDLVSLNLKNCTKLENLQLYAYRYLGNLVKVDLDISGCTALTMLNINYLTTLNATGCSSLKGLVCSGAINSVALKGCTSLETLKFIREANLRSLDVSDCSALKVLSIQSHPYSELTSLDLSTNTLLDSLTCYALVTEFDISKLQKLTYLNLSVESLSSLDVRNNNSLEELILHNFNGSSSECDVNASGSLSLRRIDCSANKIKSINAEGCTNLERFTMNENYSVSSLDLSDCVSLDSVSIRSTSVQSVKLSKNIKFLNCTSNEQLSFLDVEGLEALEVLNCYNNKLNNLALDRCILLKTLDCSGNNLNNLALDRCILLKTLNCSKNNLTSLDVSACNQLDRLVCSANKLSGSLNVSNCKDLRTLFCSMNSDLTKLIVYRNHVISPLQKDSHTALELSN